MKLRLLPVICLSFLAILSALLVVTPRTAFAASCSYQVNTSFTGVDTEECSMASYCYVCVDCCVVSSFAQMAQQFFNDYRSDFIMDSFYDCPVDESLQKLSNDLLNVNVFKIAAMGAFLDGSVLNDTLLAMSATNAETLKTYTPSDQICKFGTLTRALAASEARMDNDRMVLSEIGLTKSLGKVNSVSAGGRGSEYEARLRVFVEKFCSLKDNNNGLDGTCMSATPVQDLQHNRDVDYARLMSNGMSINGDFTDTNETMDETSMISLAHFLYGHRQPTKRPSFSEMTESQTGANLYQEYRSVVARRAAAQNTFNTQASMRLAGSGGSDTYIRQVLSYIGMSAADADAYLGAKNSNYAAVKTSYNGQMNLLAKQLYQDPAFYANLMDSKANVKRTSAAIQGIGLMQGRDTYRSMARTEMLSAILVELEALRIANNVQGEKTK